MTGAPGSPESGDRATITRIMISEEEELQQYCHANVFAEF